MKRILMITGKSDIVIIYCPQAEIDLPEEDITVAHFTEKFAVDAKLPKGSEEKFVQGQLCTGGTPCEAILMGFQGSCLAAVARKGSWRSYSRGYATHCWPQDIAGIGGLQKPHTL